MTRKASCSACSKSKVRCVDGPPCCRCDRLGWACNKSSDCPPNHCTRRQYRSCDNCRQTRHACDAFVIDKWRNGDTNTPSRRCTRCSEALKKCTFDTVSKLLEAKLRKRKSRKAKQRNWSTAALIATNSSHLIPLKVQQQQLTNVTDKHMIIHQLLQGYDGLFEVPVWFWSSKRNCPYHTKITDHLSSVEEALHPESRLEFMVRELDSRGGLGNSEQKKAWKVLNMAILAFTSQWLVDSSPLGDQASRSDLNAGYNTIRSALWYEANRQIQGIAGMSSFQVILATIIFALTHPPLDATGLNNLSTAKTTLVKQAITQLFQLRKRSDSNSRDDQSINLLFWFGLIFDTISSASKRQPVAILDEDCVVLHEGQKSELWCLSTFQARRPNHAQTGIGILHEEAVPISILLVRKCIHLKKQIDLGSPPDELEYCINECLDIYDHWIETYYDVMDHYFRSLYDYSWRILSWIVGLRIRWHWSCLILMELIERVDGSNSATFSGRRCCSMITSSIKWQSAISISDVARASLIPATSEAMATLIGFGLLNDPWTELMIEAMQLALEILSSGSDMSDGELHVRKRSCMNCISLLVSRSTSIKRFQLDARGLTTEDGG